MDELKGQRCVVTGGAGFVGSSLVRALNRVGAQVVVLDDLSNGSLENLREASCEMHLGCVTDAGALSKLVQAGDIVFHLAARNIIHLARKPYTSWSANILGTLNVLEAAREKGARKVIYASTASVYGNPRYLPINEDDGINLLSHYAVSKYAGEGYCRVYAENGLAATVLRFSNVYGPRQRAGVTASMMCQARLGLGLTVHGDGLQTRDYTFVEDTVEAALLAAVSSRADGEVFNVATGMETSVLELGRLVCELFGVRLEVATAEKRDIDNIRRRALNTEKIRRVLRWAPRFTLAAGLAATYEWMRQES